MRYGKFGVLAAGVAALAASAGLLVGGSGAAIASGGGGPTPPWESSISSSLLGSITFYNAQGQVVTGGSITAAGLAAYAVASAPYTAATGYDKATLFAYTPVAGQNPLTWSGEGLSLSTKYPNTSAPVPINGTANPVETNSGTDTSLSDYITAFPNTQTTSGYPGLYDIRMKISGPGLPTPSSFYDTVISINTTTNTWSVDYPDWTQSTTTTLTANPPTEATSAPITLTATVAPTADSGGTVSFWNGTTQVGTTQTVSSGGTASVTDTPANGTTNYKAIFTPTIGSADVGSSGSLAYVVGTGPAPTTTTLMASPASPVSQGASVTLTATEVASDSTNPPGSVQFFDGTTSLGSMAVNSSGVAALTTSSLPPTGPAGEPLTATFTPTNTAGYSASTSSPVTYQVNPVAAKPTLSGPHQAGKSETCNETLASGVTATYAWLANNKQIGTGKTFTVPGTAYKAALACEASVSDGGGPVSSATSTSATVLRGAALTPLKRKGPSLSGPHKVGKTEKVNPGDWNDPGASKVSFTYQWLLNGKVIKHATKSSLKLTKGDKGKKISCRVTAHAPGFANGSVTTSSVKVS